jgi:CheY-like chemotaxis protein
MTLGSAACLPRHNAGARLRFCQPLQKSGLTAALQTMNQGAPPTHSPPCLAAEHSPMKRILIVENQAIVALDLQRVLKEAGYKVVGPASSVTEADRLIARGSLDCAILDFDGDNGIALAVADRLERSNIPWVFLADNLGDLQAHSARSIVGKPYTKDELLAALRCAIEDQSQRDEILYATAPAQFSWPRVMPQL